jgi:hypothetical protein
MQVTPTKGVVLTKKTKPGVELLTFYIMTIYGAKNNNKKQMQIKCSGLSNSAINVKII